MDKRTAAASAAKIAIACQGGGSLTAFTAGALKTLLAGERHGNYRITALSGTSGGAICAALSWCGLLAETTREAGRKRAIGMLEAFWQDNSALLPSEQLWNILAVMKTEFEDAGLLPKLAWSPYLPAVEATAELGKTIATRREFFDLRQLLEKHLDVGRLAQREAEPRLLLGAIAVLSGEFKAFDSWLGEISPDSILASTTLPSAAKATRIGQEVYWDGLFSQNPPLRDFVKDLDVADKPDEIWIIRINPQQCLAEPTTSEAIQDRRNELAGNLSLNQEIDFIEKVNDWLEHGKLASDDKKQVRIRQIGMSDRLAARLDYASKLNRDPHFIAELMADGEKRAAAFLTDRNEESPRLGATEPAG